MDYYNILGVSRDATTDEIKKSYRQLALEFHPDRNPGDAEAERRFKEIAEAYETLSSPEKRFVYDNPKPQGPFAGFGGFGPFPFGMNGVNFSFTFDRPPPSPIPEHGTLVGKPIHLVLDVTPFQLMLGLEVKIRYARLEHCDECGGHGADLRYCPTCEGHGIKREVKEAGRQRRVIDSPCEDCGNTGILKENVCARCGGTGLIQVEIDRDINLTEIRPDGTKLIKDGGNFGPFQGPAGALVLMFKVVYPDPSNISEEDKKSLLDIAKRIYNSVG
jgi:molecular chaperone DnaJ